MSDRVPHVLMGTRKEGMIYLRAPRKFNIGDDYIIEQDDNKLWFSSAQEIEKDDYGWFYEVVGVKRVNLKDAVEND
jgi:hypothetical protein